MKRISLNLLRLSLVAAVLVCIGFSARADEASDVPVISMYYPGANPDSPYELKSTTKAYVYFTNYQIVSAKAQVIQNGEMLGTVSYQGSYNSWMNKWSTSATMNPAEEGNEVMRHIALGRFTLSVYEVTYISNVDGLEKTYSDPAHPLGTVDYMRGQEGFMTEHWGLESGVIRSWYPADAEDGVKYYRFNTAINPDAVVATLRYGSEEEPNAVLPTSVSADGKVLSVDLRGALHNVATLCPGRVFVDDNGQPCDPPTTITLAVDNIYGAKGESIMANSIGPDGREYTFTGLVYIAYNYDDITQADPVLTKAEFYSASDPSMRYININGATDMMDLLLEDETDLSRADIKFTSGALTEVVPFEDIARVAGCWTVALPASVRAAGSSRLSITLVNLEYPYIDGAEHGANVLDLSSNMTEVATLAALAALPDGQKAVLVTDGITVTVPSSTGYTFAEDASRGIRLSGVTLDRGNTVKGRVVGTYRAALGQFNVVEEESAFTITAGADVQQGKVVEKAENIIAPENEGRLLSLVAGSNLQFATDAATGYISAGGKALLIPDLFNQNYKFPADLQNVTGVLTKLYGMYVLMVRDEADVNADITVEHVAATIADIRALEPMTRVTFVGTMNVNFVAADSGVSFVEDATGALMLSTDDGSLFSATAHCAGGMLVGTYYGNGVFEINVDESDWTDVEIEETPTELPVADLADDSNNYRLVRLVNSETQPITATGLYDIMVDGCVAVVDMFDVLPYDYNLPDKIGSVTGIVYPMAVDVAAEDGAESVAMPLLVLRSAADIASGEDSGIGVTIAPAEAGVAYDLRGVRVDLTKLAKGIYIIDGRKTLVK